MSGARDTSALTPQGDAGRTSAPRRRGRRARACPRAELAADRPNLRPSCGDLAQVAALEPPAPGLPVADRPDAVPFDLEPVGVLVPRQAVQAGEHGEDALRKPLTRRILRRVHAVDPPMPPSRA